MQAKTRPLLLAVLVTSVIALAAMLAVAGASLLPGRGARDPDVLYREVAWLFRSIGSHRNKQVVTDRVRGFIHRRRKHP